MLSRSLACRPANTTPSSPASRNHRWAIFATAWCSASWRSCRCACSRSSSFAALGRAPRSA
jgi:hypothetical protein